jgi:hypothetical protein
MAKWQYKCEVPGSQGHTWVVSQAEDGTWGCSCPVWKFKRKECHHIANVKASPPGPLPGSIYATLLPQILPGHVERMTYNAELHAYLHPLIPLNAHGTGVLATIVYDCLQLGYSMEVLRERFKMIPKEWTAQAVIAHVKRYGFTVWRDDMYRQITFEEQEAV